MQPLCSGSRSGAVRQPQGGCQERRPLWAPEAVRVLGTRSGSRFGNQKRFLFWEPEAVLVSGTQNGPRIGDRSVQRMEPERFPFLGPKSDPNLGTTIEGPLVQLRQRGHTKHATAWRGAPTSQSTPARFALSVGEGRGTGKRQTERQSQGEGKGEAKAEGEGKGEGEGAPLAPALCVQSASRP